MSFQSYFSGKHYLFLDTVQNSGALHREMGLRLYMAPSLSFTNSQMKQLEWSQKFYSNVRHLILHVLDRKAFSENPMLILWRIMLCLSTGSFLESKALLVFESFQKFI